MNDLKLAVVQLTSNDTPADNLTRIEAAYAKAVEQGAELVVCPENSIYLRIQAGSKIEGLSADQILRLEKLVQSAALMVTTPTAEGAGKFRNSTWMFEPGKSAREVYTKIHLFDVDVDGAPSVRESDFFVNGPGPRLIEYRGWKLGLSICYDVRFSELYSAYAQKADVVLVPSAFLVPTGEAHWHTLLRARAIEGQCYVAAPAQSGAHTSGGQTRKTYGHSLVVNPWGKVMLDLDGGPDVATVTLSHEEIMKVRRQIPMERHRRLARD